MSPPENKISPPVAPAGVAETPLRQPVAAVWGVGEERAKQLARLGICTVEDLLLHKPRRYEDRRKFLPILHLKVKEAATVRGTIIASGVKRFRKGARSMFECVFDDGTAHLHCRWWQAQPWMPDWYAVGREFLIFGKLDDAKKPRTFTHPETEYVEPGEDEFIHVNRIVPIHPLTDGLTARVMRSLVWRALERYENEITEPQVGGVTPCAPASATPEQRSRSGTPYQSLPSRANAMRMIHFPQELTDVEIARHRLALDEFVALQFQIQSRRKKFEALAKALPCGGDNRLMKPFLTELGFKLTNAQANVLKEIRSDMGGAHPMRRLLQGDVGSGKTAVAACSALMALESGFNVALMAPTEILAEQHFRNFTKWFKPLGVKVELQTGSRKSGEDGGLKMEDGKRVRPAILHSPSSIFIGTHALFTAGFELPKLGLVIIDEQHKFGVAQRETLVRKGNYPHLLVMTATPIPRTLGLTLYGDLDVSVIDELPGGRGAIKTFVRAAGKLPKVFEFIREKISNGRQAYIVYPRVEATDKDVKAVLKEFENVQRALAPFKVGLLHGRMKGAEKENVMKTFRANEIKAIVATSLIEVGVDVPNATVMLIENAEQFGLAQLHQLRGRIGRGAHESFCILISDVPTEDVQARLKILEQTNDGFKIAEADLKLRGPGELLGQEQSGSMHLRFGDLTEDLNLIRQARELVKQSF